MNSIHFDFFVNSTAITVLELDGPLLFHGSIRELIYHFYFLANSTAMTVFELEGPVLGLTQQKTG